MKRQEFLDAANIAAEELGVLPTFVLATHQRLPVMARKIMVRLLHDYAGWSYDECAYAFEKSYGTVKYYAHALPRHREWDQELDQLVRRCELRFLTQLEKTA